VSLKKTNDNHKITFLIIQLNKKRTTRKAMDYIRKMVKALIVGYVITLIMLGVLTYLINKFALSEKMVDNIIFGIYIAGSFTGGMLSAWMIKRKRVIVGSLYGMIYIVVLLTIAALMKKQVPDNNENMLLSVLASVAAGAFGGFFSP